MIHLELASQPSQFAIRFDANKSRLIIKAYGLQSLEGIYGSMFKQAWAVSEHITGRL